MIQKYTYQLGFNAGYILRKYSQALISKLLPKITSTHDYVIGMEDGSKEYELEMQKDKLNEVEFLRSRSDRVRDREL